MKVRLDGFSKPCDAGYFDPVPTQCPPAVYTPLMQFMTLVNNFTLGIRKNCIDLVSHDKMLPGTF